MSPYFKVPCRRPVITDKLIFGKATAELGLRKYVFDFSVFRKGVSTPFLKFCVAMSRFFFHDILYPFVNLSSKRYLFLHHIHVLPIK